MKKITSEFKEFISRGNVVDLAVGVVIGSAFTAIVNSFVNDIIMPLINLITGGTDGLAGLKIDLPRGNAITYGTLIAAFINFLLISLVVFIIVKTINKFRKKKDSQEPKEDPTLCPFCRLEVDKEATRCPHCTSEIPPSEEEDEWTKDI